MFWVATGDKLKDEREQNQELEAARGRVQLLQNKCRRGCIPIMHPPAFEFDAEKIAESFKEAFNVLINGEEYGTHKKICYFGEKTHVLKMDLESETWEHVELSGSHEISYYAAAVSTHDGNALIAGGGNSQDAFLFIEKSSILSLCDTCP